ncbi:uncharacterized protein NPIL_200051 [Nephila pilipes]|uniref:EFHB C-terminal EF-hand domain-containing protein n=1 Tax=Nephila pilipes TaxID=299642 RepID=A0A8X6MWP4_NEPPI|nr:uncharacterized protein NPIL_200051 [Nephila pilipes]
MKKQHFITEVSSLVNPPLLTKYKQLQQESMEKIYASKRFPLGRTHSPNIPWKAMSERFGMPTEKGDSAYTLMHPLNCNNFHSMYTYDFPPLVESSYTEIPSAGIKSEVIDNSGSQIKKLLNETGNVEPTVIIPLSRLQTQNIKKEVRDKHETHLHMIIPKNNMCCLTTCNPSKTNADATNLLIALWNLVKNKKTCYRKNFTSFLKSYLQNFSKTFAVSDLQKMFENFDVCISKHTLKQVLNTFGVIDNEENINYDKFLKALKWESMYLNAYSKKSSKYLDDKNKVNHFCDISAESFKTTASVIGDHKFTVFSKVAGIPSLRNDIRKPNLKSVVDFNEYGDVKNAASVIQPNIFEKYGIYEKDLGVLKSQEEIKTMLFKSGIYLNNGTFDMIWDSVNEQGKANIGEIWNVLKHLCLSKNNLFV